MISTAINILYAELETHLQTLESKFIASFLPTVAPLVTPSEYEHFVKAYCVLSHAAIEDFTEKVALRVMSQSIEEWIMQRKSSETLITLVCFYGSKLNISDNENENERSCYQQLKEIFDVIKRDFSQDIHKNHGISIKYLRRLLTPIAIDIPTDVITINSLQQLANERGDYAHKSKARRVLSPEDAQKYVYDCLNLCSEIRNRANTRLS